MMDRKMVNFIKEQYPPGTRIRLNSMEDPYAPILPGTEGEVDYVDDAGQLHMKWDNGRSLALVLNYGYNRFNFTLMYSLVVVLIIITQFIQSLGSYFARKARRR